MWQVGQEMLRLEARASMGYYVDTYVEGDFVNPSSWE